MAQRARRTRQNTACLPPADLFNLLVGRGVPPCVALLSLQCLHWDPNRRATAEDCLQACDWLYSEEDLDEVQAHPPSTYGVPPHCDAGAAE